MSQKTNPYVVEGHKHETRAASLLSNDNVRGGDESVLGAPASIEWQLLEYLAELRS